MKTRSGPSIHPTAVVDPGAIVGEDARIWHFCHLMPGAIVGEGSSLGQNVFVGGTARVGARVKVQNNVSLFDGVEVEDDAFIGPSVVFTNVDRPRSFLDQKSSYLPTRVGRGATLGAGSVIVCGHSIGAYSFVGAGSVVTHDVPAHAQMVGNPARRVGWVCRCGARLAEASRSICLSCNAGYRIESETCTSSDGESTAEDPPPVPFADLSRIEPELREDLDRAFQRVLSSGKYVLGEEVTRFEHEAAALIGAKHAIGVSSGSDALLVSLMALDIGPGDEVITTAYSFFATVGAILRVGATPVFADIRSPGFGIDPEAVARAIGPRTRAILPVDLFGRVVDRAIFDLGRDRSIPVVEDAAQAFGARTEKGFAGVLGRIGCFSFFPTKGLGALGDGGLVVTDDEALSLRIRSLRSHGAASRYEHTLLGGNFRLDALQAAFLRAKLPWVDRWTATRRRHAEIYRRELGEVASRGDLLLPPIEDGDIVGQYVVRSSRRDSLRESLRSAGISTEIYYPSPLHLQPALGRFVHRPGSFPHAERASAESLALPAHASLSSSQIERVARQVRSFFSSSG